MFVSYSLVLILSIKKPIKNAVNELYAFSLVSLFQGVFAAALITKLVLIAVVKILLLNRTRKINQTVIETV